MKRRDMNESKFRLENVVLFDGVCNLCNSSVDFIVSHERRDTLKFTSIQSEIGKKIVKESGISEVPDSILFYTGGKLYVRSTAVLMVAGFLSFPWILAVVFRIIPRFLRDAAYKTIAANRYKWFGKSDTCRVPTSAEREKFLG
ncbi:MAG: putative DCC family thiol-disulfide oxidoreductase YuxK [Bacteroidia bacterium]|jgi:predicted DCC family thiol-disulfide oxidoreductase YuxK